MMLHICGLTPNTNMGPNCQPNCAFILCLFFFSCRRRHTRLTCDWISDVCSSDLLVEPLPDALAPGDGARETHVAEMRALLNMAMTRASHGLVLAYAAHSGTGAAQPPSPFAEEARNALGAQWEDREEELFGPDESLHATYQALRDELVAGIPRTGARLGE